MSQSKKHIGSTMLPDKITAPNIQTNAVETNTFNIQGSIVDELSHDPKDDSQKHFPSSFALSQLQRDLNIQINMLESSIVEYIYMPVFGAPITDPNFRNLEEWALMGFDVDDGSLSYINKTDTPGDNNASFYLRDEAFLVPGQYYVDIIVDRLPEGSTIVISTYLNDNILTITESGRYGSDFIVEDPNATQLIFTVNDVPLSGEVKISHCGIHYIREAFVNYLDMILAKLLKGNDTYITVEDLDLAITNVQTTLQQYVTHITSSITGTLNSHITDTTNNPHGITPDMIDAAHTDHTHTFDDIHRFEEEVFVPLNSAISSINNLLNMLNDHLSANNPHGITPDMIDAAHTEHTHDMSDILNLNTTITNIQNSISDITTTDISNIQNQINDIKNSIVTINADIAGVNQDLTDHMSQGIDAHDAHLASVDEAQAGVDDEKLMTPSTTKLAVESWFNRIEDTVRLQPALTCRVILSSTRKIITIPMTYGSRYMFRFSGEKQHDITTLSITTDKVVTGAVTYIVKSSIDGTIVRSTGYDEHRLALKAKSIYGEYEYDTLNDTLIGRGVCYSKYSDVSVPDEGPWDMKIISCPSTPIKVEHINELRISTTDMTADASTTIDVYELIPYQEQPVITDSDPAGVIKIYLSGGDIDGYNQLNGTELFRDEYKDLYDHAFATNNIIPQSTYDSLIASTGQCDKFGSGNGNTTFTLPTITDGSFNYYIKLKNKYVTSSMQVLYELDWTNP